MSSPTVNQLLREIERALSPGLTIEARSAAYEAELVRRYHAGHRLSTADKREARRIIQRTRH
ncbi:MULTISPECIES: hypothetical protein [unclassified Bradyrhizobium]|uniref:hypothetical protein n=1 Tax=unclassified Bradyrhizobium TaxID=2631580 RepID=UPI002915EA1E|nr:MULTISPECIES: hypothetical protein [unclassified Bradyrhizobium]